MYGKLDDESICSTVYLAKFWLLQDRVKNQTKKREMMQYQVNIKEEELKSVALPQLQNDFIRSMQSPEINTKLVLAFGATLQVEQIELKPLLSSTNWKDETERMIKLFDVFTHNHPAVFGKFLTFLCNLEDLPIAAKMFRKIIQQKFPNSVKKVVMPKISEETDTKGASLNHESFEPFEFGQSETLVAVKSHAPVSYQNLYSKGSQNKSGKPSKSAESSQHCGEIDDLIDQRCDDTEKDDIMGILTDSDLVDSHISFVSGSGNETEPDALSKSNLNWKECIKRRRVQIILACIFTALLILVVQRFVASLKPVSKLNDQTDHNKTQEIFDTVKSEHTTEKALQSYNRTLKNGLKQYSYFRNSSEKETSPVKVT